MKECKSCSQCYVDESQTCSAPDCVNQGGPLIYNAILANPVIEGRYELKKRLGRGSMGAVYQARHLLLKSSHAIKIILTDVVGHDDSLPARFRQEAVAAAAIRHPNIIAVTDYGFVDGATPFLVMDLIEGCSLAEIIERESPMTPERALALMKPIVAGVGAAHRRGIVHRDLKPLNIMVSDGLPLSEGVKVLDFGLAKIRSHELLGSMVSFQTQGAVGSPYYMPPEQWGEGQPDERSDIYSLGVILYQMLAGRLPFFGGSLPELMKQHLLQPPSEEGLTHLSEPLLKVLRQALAKTPEDRFPDAGAFIGAFHKAIAAPAPSSKRHAAASLADTITLDDSKLSADQHELTLNEARREVEAARRQAQEAARQHAEADAQSLAAEESLRRKAAKIAEEQAAAEAARQAAEAEAARQAAAEAARLQAEAEARQQAEAEAARRAAEETRLRVAEAASQRAAAEARQRAAEEALQQQAAAVAQEQAAAAVQQETAEAARQTAVEAHQTVAEAARLQAEAQTQQQMAEDALLQAEAAAHQREATIARLQAEAAAEQKVAEQARQASAKAQQEMANAARLQAAAEAQERSAEEARQHAEELGSQRAAEAVRLQSDLETQQRALTETQQQLSETLLRQAAAETQQQAAEELAQEKLLATRTASVGISDQNAAAATPNRHNAVTISDSLPPLEKAAAAAAALPAQAVTATAPAQEISVPDLAPSVAAPAVNAAPAAANPVLGQSLFKAWGPAATTLAAPSPRKLLFLLLPALVFLGLAWLLLQRACAGAPNAASTAGPTAAQPPSGMVLLLGGAFEMGRSDVPENAQEYPAHQVSVKSFYLDETEVTNGEYARFLQATTGHTAPAKPPPARGELLWRDWTGNQPPAGQEQWPVRNISLAEAQAFAAWRTQRDGLACRLPTEEEWEFAARGGPTGNLYPWGRSWIDGHANMKKYDAANPNQPAAVRSFPNDRAAAGVFDLVGNVHEWTNSKASYYEGNAKRTTPAEQNLPVIRGGAYSVAQDLNAASRQWTPQTKDPAIGFRLACELRQ